MAIILPGHALQVCFEIILQSDKLKLQLADGQIQRSEAHHPKVRHQLPRVDRSIDGVRMYIRRISDHTSLD